MDTSPTDAHAGTRKIHSKLSKNGAPCRRLERLHEKAEKLSSWDHHYRSRNHSLFVHSFPGRAVADASPPLCIGDHVVRFFGRRAKKEGMHQPFPPDEDCIVVSTQDAQRMLCASAMPIALCGGIVGALCIVLLKCITRYPIVVVLVLVYLYV